MSSPSPARTAVHGTSVSQGVTTRTSSGLTRSPKSTIASTTTLSSATSACPETSSGARFCQPSFHQGRSVMELR